MKKDIIIGQGLKEIKFGMTKEALKTFLGEPDEVDTYSYSDSYVERGESWHYDKYDLSVSFDEEDGWRLGTLSVGSPEFSIKGTQLIGLPREKAVKKIKKLGLGEMEFEDLSSEDIPEHYLLSIDDASINVWFDEGVVSEIQWGVLWKDEQTPVWPT